MAFSLSRLLSALAQRLPAPFDRLPAEWRRSQFRSAVKDRYLNPAADLPVQRPKVFGIGLSRTGTTSLAHALHHLGYNTLHWSRDGKVIGWPELMDADAATDTPCSAQFEALYHTFEDAKFVYTVRDVDPWTQSIKDHFGIEQPRDFRNLPRDEAYWKPGRNWGWYNTVRRIQIHEGLYAQHDSWADAYWAFDARVRRFFDDKPDDRFLELNITEGEGWETLCPFLGLDPPDRPFPHRNRFDPTALD
jgi:hypothetical protein